MRPADAGPAGLLAFSVGDKALALPAQAVERVLEAPSAQRVPGTPRWFAGVAVVAGRLLPLTDLGVWLDAGQAASGTPDRGAGRLLELAPPWGPAGLLVDAVDGLHEFGETGDAGARGAPRPEPGAAGGHDPLDALGARRGLGRSVVIDGRARVLLDPWALVRDPSFIDLATPG